jgi:prevent-host-death family protein
MEVPISTLRAEIKTWVSRAREGEEILVTDRGVPVARLTGVESADLIERLQRDGLLDAPLEATRTQADTDKPQTQAATTPMASFVRRLRR